MAKLMRETRWSGWSAGDVFRVSGMRGRRFSFRAHVTNFETGERFIEANDVVDGHFRVFRPETRLVRVRMPVRD